MKVAIAYVFPTVNPAVYEAAAARFRESYMVHPPGEAAHQLAVVVNGPPMNRRQRDLFNPLAVDFIPHSNIGRDIGAFQLCADVLDCDLLVCLGSNIHFRKAGWLDHILRSFYYHGPAMYGCWAFHEPIDHIRTTAFWMPRELLRSYPYAVGDPQRYEFEHGHNSILNHVRSLGYDDYMVTWDGTFGPKEWHHVPNEKCLMLDQHTDRIGYT